MKNILPKRLIILSVALNLGILTCNIFVVVLAVETISQIYWGNAVESAVLDQISLYAFRLCVPD